MSYEDKVAAKCSSPVTYRTKRSVYVYPPLLQRHVCGPELCIHGECWRCGHCPTCMPEE